MLPREAPLRRLAEAIAELQGAADDPDTLHQIRRILNHGADAPAALAELLRGSKDDHFCILIDQFEELFSLPEITIGKRPSCSSTSWSASQRTRRRACTRSSPCARSSWALCARFKGLAEAVNRTQYLLPQMERPALLRAIREPATLYDGEVSRELAERLIADAGGHQDQLPLIQHGLMRLYQDTFRLPLARHSGLAEERAPFRHDHVLEEAPVSFRHETGSEEPVARPADEAQDAAQPFSFRDRRPGWRLDLDDYRSGSLAVLLSAHADQVMAAAATDPRREKVVEHLFRALTDINAEGNAIRRPQTLAQLVAVTGSDEQTLRNIIDHFREEGVSFLRAYGNKPIEQEAEIDISHEALIRCWQKIADKKGGWLSASSRTG